ncbi:MAG: M56 family metallopeptidase [Thermomicrobiales bacterium]
MMTLPNRLFLLALVVALAVAGLIVIPILVMLSPVIATVRSCLNAGICLLTPMPSVDTVFHGSTLVVAALSGAGFVAAGCAINRERSRIASLNSFTRTARNRKLSPQVETVAIATGLNGRLDVIDSYRPFGFVYGWMRPRVCVSTELIERLTPRELEAVFHHEWWHLHQRDPIRLFILRAIVVGLFFVPSLRQLLQDYVVAAEIAADRHAVDAMGDRRWLASALAKTMGLPLAMPAFEGQADARIAALAGESPRSRSVFPRFWVTALMVELVILIPLLVQGGLPVVARIWVHYVC